MVSPKSPHETVLGGAAGWFIGLALLCVSTVQTVPLGRLVGGFSPLMTAQGILPAMAVYRQADSWWHNGFAGLFFNHRALGCRCTSIWKSII